MALLIYKGHVIGSESNIDDTTVSANSTYSSAKIDETYATNQGLTQLQTDFNHFSTSESGDGNVNTAVASGQCNYVVNGHIATITAEFTPLEGAVNNDSIIITNLPHPLIDLYCNDGITNCILTTDGMLKYYYPQDIANYTRRDFTITYMTH